MNYCFNQDIYDGYILFSPTTGTTNTYLMDSDGTIFNNWNNNIYPASMPYLIEGTMPGFENTILVFPGKCNNPSMLNGGYGGEIIFYDWNGNILWQYSICNDQYQAHHDIAILPNNNILVIVWEKKTAEDAYALGRLNIENFIIHILIITYKNC